VVERGGGEGACTFTDSSQRKQGGACKSGGSETTKNVNVKQKRFRYAHLNQRGLARNLDERVAQPLPERLRRNLPPRGADATSVEPECISLARSLSVCLTVCLSVCLPIALSLRRAGRGAWSVQ
jgi:hypothetical protein